MKWKIVLIFLILIVFSIFFSDKKQEYVKVDGHIKVVEPEKNEIKLTLVGDLLFEQPFLDELSSGKDGNDYFKRVNEKYFLKDDLTIGNMEVPIGSEDMLLSGGNNYSFCSPPSVGKIVANQSIEVLSTVNNHSYDRGNAGIDSTINFFKNNSNITTVGTFLDEEDKKTLRIIEKNGIKVGFLAYTYGTNVHVPDDSKYKLSYYHGEYRENMTSDINTMREKVDLLIVLMHWGNEFTYTPNDEQKEMAKYLNELKVDIIVGSHSHCMQPIEWIGDDYKTLVYYSMGNFASSDDDIARTPNGFEEFDNSYQIGLLSTLTVTKDKEKIKIETIKTEPIINYFDKNIQNLELIPYADYVEDYELKHYRYSFGLTKSFIEKTYTTVINEEFR